MTVTWPVQNLNIAQYADRPLPETVRAPGWVERTLVWGGVLVLAAGLWGFDRLVGTKVAVAVALAACAAVCAATRLQARRRARGGGRRKVA